MPGGHAVCATGRGAQTTAELVNVRKSYPSGDGQIEVLSGIDFSVAEGEAVAIKGVSGSGKSTLLHILGAIETPTSGRVTVVGDDITARGERHRMGFRARHIGIVFQFFNLIPTLTALENVVAALEPLPGTRHERMQRASESLRTVGLADHLDKYPSQMSGGQQQRIAISRAMVKRPSLLLADEPSGALDAATARQVLDLLRGLQQSHGCALVLTTHDPVVSDYADRVLRLDDGVLGGDR